ADLPVRSADVCRRERGGVRPRKSDLRCPLECPRIVSRGLRQPRPETPFKEIQAHAARFDVPISARLPRIMVAVRVTLYETLDLSNGRLRRRLRVSMSRMAEEDWRGRRQAKRH